MVTPVWVVLCRTEVRPIISNSHDVAAIRRTRALLPSAHAQRHHPILKASFLSGPRLLFPVSITWLPYSQLVNSGGLRESGRYRKITVVITAGICSRNGYSVR